MVVRPSRRRGFTMAEVIVVVFIITLLAALIVPNFANQQKSLKHREFFSALSRFCIDARENAISEKKTLKVTLDSGQNAFVLSEVVDDEEQQRKSLELPEGMETQDFTANGQESSSSDWDVEFRPDGTTSGGGIELDDSGRIRSLVVKPDGSVQINEGAAEPEASDQRWEAGETEKRCG